jgi:putative FmdB family regulatory protein
MPTYEYVCNRCGYHFEMFQSMSAQPLADCPRCGGGVQRLFGTGGGVLFKGRGSHAADSGRTGPAGCSREQPCCGRNVPCERPPCG